MTTAIGRRMAKGSFWISSSQLLAALIGFAGSIVIARLLSPDEYGLISIALIFPGIIPGLLDIGLSSALIRYPSLDNGRRIVVTAYALRLALAVAAGIVVYSLAGFFASLLSRPYIADLIRILSIYVSGLMIIESARNILMGLGRYSKAGLLDVSRAALRITYSILLILLGLRVYGAIWGFSMAVLTLLALYPIYYPRGYVGLRIDRSVLRELFSYTFPLYIPLLLELPLNYTVRIVLARYVSNVEMGNYAVAMNLALPLIIIGNSLALAVFSSLPLLIGDRERLGLVTRKAMIYTAVIMMPLAVTLLAFSRPITYLAYGSKYSLAPTYLALSSLIGLLAPFGFYVLRPYFDATGYTGYTLRMSLVFFSLYIPLGIALIIYYRVSGFIIAFIVSRAVGLVYGVRVLENVFGLNLWSKRNVSLFTYLFIPALPVLLLEQFSLPEIPLYIKYVLEVIIYLTTLVFSLMKALSPEEIRELKTLSKELSVFGPILYKLFNLIERLSIEIRGLRRTRVD